jgi:hypothetical protein
MNRTKNEVEMRIINRMDMELFSQERNFIKRIYAEKAPEQTVGVGKIMDSLIPVVHERNCMEEYRGTLKRIPPENDEKLAFANGEINALCYALGLDTRL